MRRFLVPRTNIENVNVVQSGIEGPTQPDLATFPRTKFGKSSRAFCKACYKNSTWIEYSESKDATFGFYFFLFKLPGRAEHFGYKVFNKDGFTYWKHASKFFKDHIGSHDSKHNSCMKHYEDYNNQRQSVTSIFVRATSESEELYNIRLTCSLYCTRYLIAQGIAFCNHDESSTSLNKGNFREIVDWIKFNDEKVRDAFGCGPNNCTMNSGDIQKELATCCAYEVTKVIMVELGDRQLFVLIHESHDISVKEKMAVMLRLVVVFSNFYYILFSMPPYNIIETTTIINLNLYISNFLNDKGKVVE
ncbi:unnamed protein product [Vicia faba]|uniref:DUF4371 domain-containing protein n=1 Tax=Vicia faba TaxID=3906 RepID=A0AAV0YP16_VICFA|nr:unnamed protein product [Vicia faba]